MPWGWRARPASWRVNGSTTLKDALSLMITTGSRAVVVENGDGSTRGVVTLDMLASLAE